MKKFLLVVLATLMAVWTVSAAVNAVTPSTNDINRVNGWAHVDATPGLGEVAIDFVSTRAFYSCFEYRSDGDTSQKISEDNYNTDITDGLYPYVCVNNNVQTMAVPANEYVEVRMVFVAETDERFDWTKFDVIYPRSAEITSPGAGELVSGLVSFDAALDDKDGNDNVQWAVRQGTCAAGTGTVFGNVDGYSDPYDWDGYDFHASTDVSAWDEGEYCFIFNPTESSGDLPIRETQEFVVSHPPTDMDDCKKGGWAAFLNPEFKNQGDCISWLQSSPNAEGNKKDN